MFRAASARAPRIRPASGPLTPVIVTRRTATSEESRSHSHPPASTASDQGKGRDQPRPG